MLQANRRLRVESINRQADSLNDRLRPQSTSHQQLNTTVVKRAETLSRERRLSLLSRTRSILHHKKYSLVNRCTRMYKQLILNKKTTTNLNTIKSLSLIAYNIATQKWTLLHKTRLTSFKGNTARENRTWWKTEIARRTRWHPGSVTKTARRTKWHPVAASTTRERKRS